MFILAVIRGKFIYVFGPCNVRGVIMSGEIKREGYDELEMLRIMNVYNPWWASRRVPSSKALPFKRRDFYKLLRQHPMIFCVTLHPFGEKPKILSNEITEADFSGIVIPPHS